MKAYVKPELFYERYELSQQIAACAWDLDYADKESCKAWFDPELGGTGMPSLFTTGTSCDIDESIYENYCYFAGADGMNVFRS